MTFTISTLHELWWPLCWATDWELVVKSGLYLDLPLTVIRYSIEWFQCLRKLGYDTSLQFYCMVSQGYSIHLEPIRIIKFRFACISYSIVIYETLLINHSREIYLLLVCNSLQQSCRHFDEVFFSSYRWCSHIDNVRSVWKISSKWQHFRFIVVFLGVLIDRPNHWWNIQPQ